MVCFDLGGVLVRIHRSWQACCESAGVVAYLGTQPLAHGDFRPFDEYQGGSLDQAGYLDALSTWLGCGLEAATRVHNCILAEAYEGSEELVRDLHAAGLRTGCLSNTNALHWKVMTEDNVYPAIQSLHCKMASHEVGLLKPDEAIFRAFEVRCEMSADEIVYFDDTLPNVEAAERHGWHAFWIDHEGDTAAQMRSRLADLGLDLPRSAA